MFKRSYGGGSDRRGGSGGGDWKRGPSKFGGSKFGSNGPDRPMFSATCDACHETCQVPFKPNGSKPVYCRNCFKKDENAPSYAAPRERSFDRGERPSFDRPAAPSANNAKMEAQLSRIEAKLDELLEALSDAGEEASEDGDEEESEA